MTKHCNEVHPLFMIPPATSSDQWPTSLCHFNFVHGPPSAPGLLEHAFISRRTDGCWCQWLWRCSDHCQVCHHFRVHTGVVWESDRLESELICRFFEPPSPAGRGDSGCSASPKGTCSSYGRSGCTLPIQQHSPPVCFPPGIGDKHPSLVPGKWHKYRTQHPSSTSLQRSTSLRKTSCPHPT